ncbi:CPBP family intramembrane metalloprotease [Bacillus cereus]|uniref:CPBP family intramembrane glutamic endopeptidase n=1 Tax=Bacillus cereus TaxID=1396 RepID=UPI000BEBCD77|nr:CPBP family intramembrane glutamic endopeptidase [Bacillus cereus]PDZ04207.1 CPBP family intramembrane metalloprotease [Bacillus cereus]PEC56003.1 CPBP family intramembrane metalloprotease [Bacillus cereus]PFE46479.1 CPBP family intramembrane metalloprotease [Bacillus cereus]PFN13463.1 CPBP family intramembrane metalloprotease [Bacillus cereus]PFS79758.1 CPBP family intramembrane metalloprotease [Bacillus cereus]
METKLLETEKKIDSKSLLALGLLMITGITYQFLGKVLGDAIPNVLGMILEALWNLVLCGIIGYYFLGKISLEQFKHFKFKTLLWGLPLVVIVGVISGVIFNYIFEPATKNSVAEVISISMILFRVPFMLMGEELICTNVMIALQKLGLKFGTASIICSVLFALWHIPAYGFVPMQLLITIIPIRLALNYVWKKSNSVWVSWICHYIYDSFAFIQFFLK